jgi:hypothetical protein
VIALMLSVNSQLAQADVARTLEQTARADAFTGPSPNDNNWGRGKIDAKAAVDSVPAGAQPEFAAVADARRGGRARG